MNDRKGFILAASLILSVLAYMMLEPFLGYFLAAIILAFMLHPIHRVFRDYVGPAISSFSIVILAVCIVLVPFVFTSIAVLEDAQDLSTDLNQSDLINTTEIEQNILEYTGRSVDIETAIDSTVRSFTEGALGNFSQFVGIVTHLTIGVTLMLFLLYYMIKDGQKLVEWIKDLIPLPRRIQDDLSAEIEMTSWAVLRGHVLVAILQGLIAGIGLILTGVPNPFFWTFVMVILGFIPILGTVAVWLPASAYLFVIDKVPEAIFLFIYGIVVVSLTDNVVRPLAVDRGSGLHPAVIIIGVIGGVYMFGAVGLFVGPIILGIFKSILLVYKDEYRDL